MFAGWPIKLTSCHRNFQPSSGGGDETRGEESVGWPRVSSFLPLKSREISCAVDPIAGREFSREPDRPLRVKHSVIATEEFGAIV